LEFLTEYGLFLAKTLTFVVAIFVIVSLVASLGGRSKKSDKGHIEVTKLNEKFDHLRESLRDAMLNEDEYKDYEKAEKKRLKEEKAQKKKAAKESAKHKSEVSADTENSTAGKKRIFVLDFHGDIKASEVDSLREEITTVLTIAKPTDEVVVKVESGGGMVHSYGLASSQLVRITNKEIPLTVCVDKVAASGGYMMACVADKIVAAPFAILGWSRNYRTSINCSKRMISTMKCSLLANTNAQ
jgi:serine protease SohB